MGFEQKNDKMRVKQSAEICQMDHSGRLRTAYRSGGHITVHK